MGHVDHVFVSASGIRFWKRLGNNRETFGASERLYIHYCAATNAVAMAPSLSHIPDFMHFARIYSFGRTCVANVSDEPPFRDVQPMIILCRVPTRSEIGFRRDAWANVDHAFVFFSGIRFRKNG